MIGDITAMSKEPESGQNSDIKINTEILNERRETYTSLGDLYQIVIFTNKTFELAEQLRLDLLKEEQELMEAVFVKSLMEEDDEDLQELLFGETFIEVKRQNLEMANQSYRFLFMIVLLFVCLVFSIVLLQYNRRRKERRKRHVNVDFESFQGVKN